jgi:hypothetical protein
LKKELLFDPAGRGTTQELISFLPNIETEPPSILTVSALATFFLIHGVPSILPEDLEKKWSTIQALRENGSIKEILIIQTELDDVVSTEKETDFFREIRGFFELEPFAHIGGNAPIKISKLIGPKPGKTPVPGNHPLPGTEAPEFESK